MSEDREVAMQLAIKAILQAAYTQGIHVDALCEGAVDWLGDTYGYDQRTTLAATTIQRLAYDLKRQQSPED
ncbi:hypothetical protein SAMN03159444_01372 [Pseudomonas sp. NFACC02]|uniref:hypothetical protein n=1 Tax=Pseudomonas sp. NFACC02 TaxID=1566250 RepID=UPI0008BC5A73|nr:hypothetical protein [Pseudomonas sp. NFACC02]SEQ26752.1 hypothetical protein SAMN03159444_01372 [Pseudomonas sp. NFACC02]